MTFMQVDCFHNFEDLRNAIYQNSMTFQVFHDLYKPVGFHLHQVTVREVYPTFIIDLYSSKCCEGVRWYSLYISTKQTNDLYLYLMQWLFYKERHSLINILSI